MKMDTIEDLYNRIRDCKSLDFKNEINLNKKKKLAEDMNSWYYGARCQRSYVNSLYNHIFLVELEEKEKGEQLVNDYILTINSNKSRVLRYFQEEISSILKKEDISKQTKKEINSLFEIFIELLNLPPIGTEFQVNGEKEPEENTLKVVDYNLHFCKYREDLKDELLITTVKIDPVTKEVIDPMTKPCPCELCQKDRK